MTLVIGNRRIGADAPCFVIAEAGVNHNGDVGLARQLVDAAADAGADAIKFQVFNPELLVSATAPKADYQVQTTGGGSQRDMLRKLCLPAAAWPELQDHARRRHLEFLATPFDEESLDLLLSLGVSTIKIGSGELTHLPLLAAVASKARGVLLSTGMSDLPEVERAVAVLSPRVPLALLHCVSNYPAAPEDANLKAIETLRRRFDLPVGWSDHTEGNHVSLAAVALGACIIEKHLTVDRTLPGPDHKASADPTQMRDLVRHIRAIEQALGDGKKIHRPSEAAMRLMARRSCHLRVAVPAGHVIREQDLIMLRPGTGLSPAELPRVVGRRTTRALSAGSILAEDSIE